MLDAETKARIDSARDILVGKVPDPKSQVEQITIALIYKFMDDMDCQSEELGGKASFFSDGFKKHAWHKLIDPRLSGHERLSLYAEGLDRMTENQGLPQLFRDIFKGAFLPYRDPETLNLFLKEINGFTYDHSERLGDAFEYLLSVLGSQGEAGQFRTPRHIIDFIVRIVAPQKHETVLDPACGTAGFLISAYKHILAANCKDRPGDLLTADERGRLMGNFCGYDISPDMVRLSRANLYLHGFPQPRIHEYDALTSEERWDERYDVIMANPPFMSPKGGIRPHNRFSIKATRSEVLFVDYIAEHLNVNGRAGVIVPEGIIFQGQNAYKALRKMLMENYLWCVVSLPPGVFNPYSGVKTSILFMDKVLAKRTDEILFVKIENDGFDLGAQRRPIGGSHLPEMEKVIWAWKTSRSEPDTTQAHTVSHKRILETSDNNLSGDRYKDNGLRVSTKWPMVRLGDERYFSIESGGTPSSTEPDFWDGGIRWVTLVDIPQGDLITEVRDTQRMITEAGLKNSSAVLLPKQTVLVSSRATIGRIGITLEPMATNQGFKNIVIQDFDQVDERYVAYAVTRLVPMMEQMASGGTFKEISKTNFSLLEIPLPPLDIQRQIVAELDGYRKIIEGAKQVIANYKPMIKIDPTWPRVKLGDICNNLDGKRIPIEKGQRKPGPYPYYGASGIVDYVADFIFDGNYLLVSEDGANLLARTTPIAFSVTGKIWVNNHAHILLFDDLPTQQFVEAYLNSISLENFVTGAAQPKLTQTALNQIPIPFPDVDNRKLLVKALNTECTLVDANRKLVKIFEKKIQDKLAEIWGEVDATSILNQDGDEDGVSPQRA